MPIQDRMLLTVLVEGVIIKTIAVNEKPVTTMNVSGIKQGIYLIRIFNSTGVETKRIIIK